MERESLEMDVVFVGAGPANLSGALHLARLIRNHDEAIAQGERHGKPLGELQIAVIEKGASVGAHILSGAVMDPKALRELIPDFEEQGAPLESPVKEDYFLYSDQRPCNQIAYHSAASEKSWLLHCLFKQTYGVAR